MLQRIMKSLPLFVLAVAAACGPGRTSAATQGAAKAFDPAASDPEAVKVADEVMTAVGGEANWAKAKEIVWTQAIVQDGKLVDGYRHAWDRWNGRHQLTRPDPGGKMAMTGYDLYGDTGFASVGGELIRKEDKLKLIAVARKMFGQDAYMLVLPMKLKDAGVHLKYVKEREKEGDVLKVTFDAGVGPSAGDTYYVVVDKTSHLPTVIEWVKAGEGEDHRHGVRLTDWKEAGGLKFAGVRTVLGVTPDDAPKTNLTGTERYEALVFNVPPAPDGKPGVMAPLKVQSPGELFLIPDVKVFGEPEDERYIPKVQ